MKTLAVESSVREEVQKPDEPVNVLIVEDNAVVMAFLSEQVGTLGHVSHQATNGQEALDFLKNGQHKIDVVLLDWEMPVMDGLTALSHIKAYPEFRNIPVIMITGADKPEQMKQGLEAGAFYYLMKPVQKSTIRSVLSSAVRSARQNKTLANELKQHRMSFDLISSCKFQFSTLEEAESLAVFIANCFPEPERTLPGVGELLVNAVEHGNLGTGYDRKTELVEAGTWRSEINRLQALPENVDKSVGVVLARREDGVYMVVEDQGEGFQWKKYMEINPARAGDNYGRGIAQSRAISFDDLTYNNKGNKAIAVVRYDRELDW